MSTRWGTFILLNRLTVSCQYDVRSPHRLSPANLGTTTRIGTLAFRHHHQGVWSTINNNNENKEEEEESPQKCPLERKFIQFRTSRTQLAHPFLHPGKLCSFLNFLESCRPDTLKNLGLKWFLIIWVMPLQKQCCVPVLVSTRGTWCGFGDGQLDISLKYFLRKYFGKKNEKKRKYFETKICSSQTFNVSIYICTCVYTLMGFSYIQRVRSFSH